MYEKYLEKFKKKDIAIIGDLMLDKYLYGNVERISQEAPIPILMVEKEKYVLGGAANTASNVKKLSGNAYLFGILGDDREKEIFLTCTKDAGVITSGVLITSKKPTIQKIRVIGHKQQMLRIDYESKDYIEEELTEKLFSKLKQQKNIDAIVISDYAKGTITYSLMKNLVSYAHEKKILLLVDPKPKHKSYYYGANLIKSNIKEAEEMIGFQIETAEDIKKAGKSLIKMFGSDIIMTLGERGMAVFEKNGTSMQIPTKAKEVYDVSGAGDTVMATLALSLSTGASLKEAAILANHSAGIKVSKIGTAPVSLEELRENLKNER